MTADPESRFPASGPARQARRLLVQALAELQSGAMPAPLAAKAVEHTAAASSVLYEVENHAANEAASMSGVRLAIEKLGLALAELQGHSLQQGPLDKATEAIARTLALLYPVARGQQRRRRAAVMIDSTRSPETEPIASPNAVSIPAAPEPLGRPRRSSPPFQGREQRSSGPHRVFVEVDIGLATDSHFYTGLSQDLSTGGVFIATYDPKPAGTDIALYFALPDGHVIAAECQVRWTREASPDAPPGMGVAFKKLSPEDLAAIQRFCEQRAPLYHDSADE